MTPEVWNLFDQTPTGWALLLLAAMVVGFSKTGIAGIGILNPLLFAMAFQASLSVGVLLPLLIAADLFAVGAYRREARWRHILGALPYIFLGIAAAYLLMRHLGDNPEQLDRVMQVSIGVIVLGMLLLGRWLQRQRASALQTETSDLRPPANEPGIALAWGVAPVFGLLTGFTTMLANAAGPVFSVYLLTLALPKRQFMGTAAMTFFIVNWVKAPLMAERGLITTETLALDACLLPALAAGAGLGFLTLRHIPEKAFRTAILVLVLAASVRLIWSGLQ